jgi:DNA-binding NarL/FixJ family response regulator
VGRARRFVVGGQQYLVVSESIAPAHESLSTAEREIAALIVAGRSNADIARARGVSVRTVANQVASILRKMNAGSRFELAEKL